MDPLVAGASSSVDVFGATSFKSATGFVRLQPPFVGDVHSSCGLLYLLLQGLKDMTVALLRV